jgi:hypothetical protein
MKRKVLSLIMALALCLAAFPTAVFAADSYSISTVGATASLTNGNDPVTEAEAGTEFIVTADNYDSNVFQLDWEFDPSAPYYVEGDAPGTIIVTMPENNVTISAVLSPYVAEILNDQSKLGIYADIEAAFNMLTDESGLTLKLINDAGSPDGEVFGINTGIVDLNGYILEFGTIEASEGFTVMDSSGSDSAAFIIQSLTVNSTGQSDASLSISGATLTVNEGCTLGGVGLTLDGSAALALKCDMTVTDPQSFSMGLASGCSVSVAAGKKIQPGSSTDLSKARLAAALTGCLPEGRYISEADLNVYENGSADPVQAEIVYGYSNADKEFDLALSETEAWLVDYENSATNAAVRATAGQKVYYSSSLMSGDGKELSFILSPDTVVKSIDSNGMYVVMPASDLSISATLSAIQVPVHWVNYDGTTLLDETVDFGSVPEYSGNEPSKQEDAQYSYTFAGWDPTPAAITAETTYTALFEAKSLGHTHEYGEPEYTWSDDNSQVTVKLVCSLDSSHVLEETVDTECIEETAPGCETTGSAIYKSMPFSEPELSDLFTEKPVELPATGHDVSGEWESDENAHWKTCAHCSQAIGDDGHVGSSEHSWTERIVEQPTYDREGLKEIVCSVCGFYKESQPIPMLTPSSSDDDDDTSSSSSSSGSGSDSSDRSGITVRDASGNEIIVNNNDDKDKLDTEKPTQQDYSWFGRSEAPAPLNEEVYKTLEVISSFMEAEDGQAGGIGDAGAAGTFYKLPEADAPVQNDYELDTVQVADYNAPHYLADEASGSSIIQANSIEGSEFYHVNAATADKTVKYAELKPGDVVRTTAFNGIYISSLDKKASTYDADSKTLKNNIFASFVAFDLDHPEVFWLTGSTKVRVTSVTKGGKSTAYFFLVLADDKGFNMLQEEYNGEGKLEAGLKLRDESAEKIISSIREGLPEKADRKSVVQAINKWLTLNNEYNRTPDLSTIGYRPHRSISALAGSTGNNGPVCDGYARAFKLLCDRMGVPCMLQGGYAFVSAGAAPEYHMWNQIQMEDENWYGADICWNDPVVSGAPAPVSGKENESWLFAGADSVIGGLKFSESHQAEEQSEGDANYFSSLNIYLSGYSALTTMDFGDVGLGDWFYEYVKLMKDRGLMEGTSEGRFSPLGTSTRAQIAMVLYRMAGKPVTEAENSFSDVNASDWFFDPVLWAKAAEITDGVSAGKFGPQIKITREQIITFLYRYADSKGTAGEAHAAVLDRFSDKDQISEYAKIPMAWAVENGILEGRSNAKLAPADTANRAELAAILARFIGE